MSDYLAQPVGTPEVLYKYRYFDPECYHLNILKNSSLYLTSYESFNDPYDSTLQFDFNDDPPGVIKSWAHNFVNRMFPHKTAFKRYQMAESRLKEILSVEDYFEWFSQHQLTSNAENFGLCALTSRPDNLLMWAHYSYNHTGFCVGFNSKKLLDAQIQFAKEKVALGLLKIEYLDTIPKINFFQSMMETDHGDDLVRLMTIKSVEWDYEDEYRLLLWDQANIELEFTPPIISEVRLGCKILDTDREQILGIVQSLDQDITVYQARLSSSEFKMDFEKIDY